MTPARRRAAGLVVVGLVLAVACTFLGRWQWHRHEWRDTQIATVERNYDAAPVAIGDVLACPAAPLADDDEWRQVALEGRYVPEATVLLRNRPVEGRPSYHVLVPFQVTGTDELFVVDRGWVPTGEDASADVEVAEPPAGDVRLVARIRHAENPSSRGAPAGWVQALAPEQVLAAAGLDDASPYLHVYGQLVSEDPAASTTLGALPAPDLDPGSHLSYAFQWWVFALGGLVGFIWLARREVVEERDGTGVPGERPRGPERSSAQARAARPRRREGRAEAEEDALIDAQARDGHVGG